MSVCICACVCAYVCLDVRHAVLRLRHAVLRFSLAVLRWRHAVLRFILLSEHHADTTRHDTHIETHMHICKQTHMHLCKQTHMHICKQTRHDTTHISRHTCTYANRHADTTRHDTHIETHSIHMWRETRVCLMCVRLSCVCVCLRHDTSRMCVCLSQTQSV